MQRFIQAKLEVSHPGDPYEREADQDAARIVALPPPTPHPVIQLQAVSEEEKKKAEQAEQLKPPAAEITRLTQRQVVGDEDKGKEKEEKPVQMKALRAAGPETHAPVEEEDDKRPSRVPAAGAAGSRLKATALTPDAVLQHQRLIGNCAVSHLGTVPVQRQGPAAPPSADDLDKEYHDALGKSPPDWAHAAEVLNGFNDDDIKSRVLSMNPGGWREMLPAVQPWNSRVRAALLDALYDQAKSQGDWNQAVIHLNGFNDTDIDHRLEALDPPGVWASTEALSTRSPASASSASSTDCSGCARRRSRPPPARTRFVRRRPCGCAACLRTPPGR